MGVTVPTSARLMNTAEYAIVSRVFGDTLPWRQRIIITNGAGLEGRAFTIPTSLLTTLGATVAAGFAGAIGGYLTSFINLAYLINVGSDYPDMSSSNQNLLVHETAHVWQGKNSNLSLTYVFSSCISQCVRGSGAYSYTAGSDWSSYGVEQQASIVEDWFAAGEPESGNLWGYIRDHVREGDA
jgi:hypothetical protein